MFELPDHPVVRNMMQTGYPDGKEPEVFRCPVCETPDAETFYFNGNREIVGCDMCLTARTYYEVEAGVY